MVLVIAKKCNLIQYSSHKSKITLIFRYKLISELCPKPDEIRYHHTYAYKRRMPTLYFLICKLHPNYTRKWKLNGQTTNSIKIVHLSHWSFVEGDTQGMIWFNQWTWHFHFWKAIIIDVTYLVLTRKLINITTKFFVKLIVIYCTILYTRRQ